MKNLLLLSVFLYLLTPVFGQSKTGFEEWSLDDSLTSFIPFEQVTDTPFNRNWDNQFI